MKEVDYPQLLATAALQLLAYARGNGQRGVETAQQIAEVLGFQEGSAGPAWERFLLDQAGSALPEDRHRLLTHTEREMLAFLEKGYNPTRISQETRRSLVTVKGHLRSIRRKLGVRSTAEAVAL